MVRSLAIAATIAALFGAPLQCGGEPEPSMRPYETPAEALYGLSEKFKAKGDDEAWRTTLEYLAARYPNSRFAKMARDDLARAGSGPKATADGAGAGGAAAGDE